MPPAFCLFKDCATNEQLITSLCLPTLMARTRVNSLDNSLAT